MQKVYGYIRVSTIRQGTHGVSLQEQKDSIIQHAKNNNLEIVEWYEERETAAKQGRPLFLKMLKNLRSGKVSGVIIHKIDRSARNLKDWATLGDIIDSGIDVHFSYESLDMRARGGRLSADIQAVIAADFIRNLREETRKGFYGRLKQGLYPLRAPVGYLDKGGRNPKARDPIQAPLVIEAFKMYSTGEYPFNNLREILHERGFRNRDGGRISLSGISTILHNPFYMGIIRLKSTGETFKGVHEPLISKSLFDAVQNVINGRTQQKKGPGKYSFLFRRLFSCKTCGYSFIGENQKIYKYYRCHTKTCKGSCLHEDIIEEKIQKKFAPLNLCKHQEYELDEIIKQLWGKDDAEKDKRSKELKLRQANAQARIDRLVDAYLEKVVEKDSYLRKKEALLKELRGIEEELSGIDQNTATPVGKFVKKLELVKSLNLSYFHGNTREKRQLLKIITSNRQIDQKNVLLQLKSPFKELVQVYELNQCDLCRGETRRMGKLSSCKMDNEKLKYTKKQIYKIFEEGLY